MKYLKWLAVLFILPIAGCGAVTENAPEAAEAPSYTGPALQVTVQNPGARWDTVHADVRAYMDAAREQYVSGDISFTVKEDEELHKKSVPVEFAVTIENSEFFTNPVIEIAEDETFADCITVSLEQKNAEYTASYGYLKTGTDYLWRVSATGADGSKVDGETYALTTEPGPRILVLSSSVLNVRDVGGWDTADGRRVLQGMVYRGKNADEASNRDLKVLLNTFKIKTELDLRKPATESMNSPLKDTVQYVNIPGTSYGTFFEDLDRTASIMRVFAMPENYPIYLHCVGGADRTGLHALMLKALCGVGETDLIIDYELTPHRYRIGYEKDGNNFDFPGFYKKLLALPGETLQEKAFLFYRDQCGLSEMELANIQKMMMDTTAVFTNPPQEAVKAEGGKVAFAIDLRSSGDVASVTAADGAKLPFTFENGTLKVTVSGSGSATVTFTDGSTLPILWK